MTKFVLLDSGPLGAVTHPRANSNQDIKDWLQGLLLAGCTVMVPEIADYELRRELVRANKIRSVVRLDALKRLTGYMPLDTDMMVKAADFWAQARRGGFPTASDESLDADVILSAQATTVGGPNDDVVIATTNVGHLSRFVSARHWRDISPNDC
jgi:hypothetical protein